MTREELILYGKDYLHDLETACCKIEEKHKEFVRESIKALEQEPCEDAISRQYVIEKLNEVDGTAELDKAFEIVENAPSVNNKGVTVTDFADRCRECGKQKKGKWICVHHLENKITYDSWKCSECQHDFNSEEESMVDFDEYKFCPNCGSFMRGEED